VAVNQECTIERHGQYWVKNTEQRQIKEKSQQRTLKTWHRTKTSKTKKKDEQDRPHKKGRLNADARNG